MNPHIFREYDIRGVVGKDIAIDDFYDLTRAIVTYMRSQQSKLKTIVVSRDGRTSSPAIYQKVTQAIRDMGYHVADIGICPTPVMYFALHNYPCQAGLQITASHNPKEYNGIKMCIGKQSLLGSEIQHIRKLYESKHFDTPGYRRGKIGGVEMDVNYIAWMKNHFKHLQGLELSAIIDCGNGATCTIIPKLIAEMGFTGVKLLHAELDGNFPNHDPDPTDDANMHGMAEIMDDEPQYKLGIGFDGDGDRMAPMNSMGFMVPGDKLLAIFSKPIAQLNKGSAIVYDIKSSSGLPEMLEKWGANPCISPSGHSMIKHNMNQNKALLAGELSCHFFFGDRYFGYDDGIYAFLRLVETIHNSGQSLDQLAKDFPRKVSSPEFRIPCNEQDKSAIIASAKQFFEDRKDAALLTIDGVRAQLPYGWGLARASNKQPVICLRFESDSEEGLDKVKGDFAQALKEHYNQDELATMINL